MQADRFGKMMLAGAVTAPQILTAQAQPAPKPNILFIAIDDMNDWTGFLGGHPQAVTPNMDRLARRGVNFTNAHCPAPGCSPSRNAILYGAEPYTSGLYLFYEQAALPPETLKPYTSLIRFFKDHGYSTFGSGKIHHRPVEESGEWTGFMQARSERLIFDQETGYQQGKSWKENYRSTLNPFDEHTDYRNTSFGVEALGQTHENPFFIAVGIIKPHLPFTCPKAFFDLYPDPVNPPRIKEDDLDDIPWAGRTMASRNDDRRFKRDNAWDHVRRAYLACISWADYNVGRLLDALEASPYADNTIIVLWSDHGFSLGEKSNFTKFALWEEATRVPFILYDPRQEKAPEGRTVSDAVSLIHIYRTLAELAGLTPPEYVDGFSLVPQLKNPDLPVGSPAVCTWGRGNYAVRDAEWRYIRYFDGSEELYLHSRDPDEWTNLADNPEYESVKQRLAVSLPKTEAPLVEQGLELWSRNKGAHADSLDLEAMKKKGE